MHEEQAAGGKESESNKSIKLERWFTPLSESLVCALLNDSKIPEGAFIVHAKSQNEFSLTLKRGQEICQIGVVCISSECKFAIGKGSPVYFSSLAEIVVNLMASRIRIKVDDGSDLPFKSYIKNPIPQQFWFLAGKNTLQAVDFMSKQITQNCFGVYLHDNGEYMLITRQNGQILSHEIVDTKRGFSVDNINYFADLESLVQFHMKNSISSKPEDRGMVLTQPANYSGFYASMIGYRFQEMCRKPLFNAQASVKDYFGQEFFEIESISKRYPLTYTIAQRSSFIGKNRYKNILACDQTRVRIQGVEEDYINANFVSLSYSGGMSTYILAQAPLESTIQDFWAIIIQQRVSIIIMLTNLEEKGIQKCNKYWPDINIPLNIGTDYEIRCTSETGMRDIVTRIFVIRENASRTEYIVRMFHFIAWPDFGVPRDAWGIIDLATQCNKTKGNYENQLTLVHCSAGVGRSGTYIAIEYFLNKIKAEGINTVIDIKETILNIRMQRAQSINTQDQYKFIYQVLKSYIDWKLGANKIEVDVGSE